MTSPVSDVDRVADVVVVGAGLAGCAVAIRLAEAGRRVIVLEKGTNADRKLCGEFLSPRAIAALESFGLLRESRDEGLLDVPTWSVASRSREFVARFPSPGGALSRAKLDPVLRRAAARRGAIVLEGARATNVARTAGGWRVDVAIAPGALGGEAAQSFHARVVVAATGRAARIPGLVAASPGAEFVAAKAHFLDANATESAFPRVALYGLRGAYVGVVPLGGGVVNVCYLARRETWTRGVSPEDFLHEAASGAGPWSDRWRALRERRGAWITIGAIDFRRRPLFQERGFFAGDAASIVAPLLGEGMAFALESGAFAATAVERVLREGETPATFRDLRRSWSRRLGARTRLGRPLQPLLFSPAGTTAAVALLRAMPMLAAGVTGRRP